MMQSLLSRIAISVVAVGLVAGCRTANQSTPSPTPSGSAAAGSASTVASAAPGPTFPIPSSDVDFVLNPQKLAAYDGATGSVEGTIRVQGPPAPPVRVDTKKCPAALDTYGKLFRDGPADAPGEARPLADAVVVAVGYAGSYV